MNKFLESFKKLCYNLTHYFDYDEKWDKKLTRLLDEGVVKSSTDINYAFWINFQGKQYLIHTGDLGLTGSLVFFWVLQSNISIHLKVNVEHLLMKHIKGLSIYAKN